VTLKPYVLVIAACMLTGCRGYDSSYARRHAAELRDETAALIAGESRGRIDANMHPPAIAGLEPRTVYVGDRSVRLTTDGWNPSNGLIIYPDTTRQARSGVRRDGYIEKQIAPGIVRFEYGPDP
jgi:hypothetical protein